MRSTTTVEISPSDLKIFIGVRAAKLVHRFSRRDTASHPHSQGYVYDGPRCAPENLGWRLLKLYGAPNFEEIQSGKWDSAIEETFHLAAEAEHYHKYEKEIE